MEKRFTSQNIASIFQHFLSDLGLMRSVVNQVLPSLHGGSLENTLTAPITE